MDISEFSIACKLINLKLRGFEIPTVLPPSLLASLKIQTPPAIPPLPNSTLVHPPPRPEPPKVAPLLNQQPLVQTQSLIQPQSVVNTQPQPLIPNLSNTISSVNSTIPTGIVPPMPSGVQSGLGIQEVQPIQNVQPLIAGIPPMSAQPVISSQPLANFPQNQSIASVPPLATQPLISSGITSNFGIPNLSMLPQVPIVNASQSGMPSVAPSSGTATTISGTSSMASVVASVPLASASATTSITAAIQPLPIPSGPVTIASVPRGSVTSLDRAASVDLS